MMRNGLMALAAAAVLCAGPGLAQNYEADIMAQLQGQGYDGITLSHTWLGRTRIVAMLNGDLREIVFDPNTGEILRDLSRLAVTDSGPSDSDYDGSVASAAAAATDPATSTRVGTGAAALATSTMQGQPGVAMSVTGGTIDTGVPGMPFQILQPSVGP